MIPALSSRTVIVNVPIWLYVKAQKKNGMVWRSKERVQVEYREEGGERERRC